MIRSKEDYRFYLEADRVARGEKHGGLKKMVRNWILPDHIGNFQRLLRKVEYYGNVKKGYINKFIYLFLKVRLRRLSFRLGFSIPENVFGPGLVIVHYGTIVVNAKARIGANCRIHVCTNIGASGGETTAPVLGDNVYIAPGAKIFGNIIIPSNTAIGANAAVNKSFTEEHTLIAGVPAKVIGKIDIKRIIKHI